MNILFLTLLGFETLDESNIYTDLLKVFVNNGHNVSVISPVERRTNIKTHMVNENNTSILRLKIGNTQKTNIIEKGISTLLIESEFVRAIKSFFGGVKFDVVLYSTPPITFAGAIEYVRKRDNAKTYLLLKDIFPQNALDIGMMKKHGPKSILYRHFRKKEKKLYLISDRIGCMSQANVDYIKKFNPELDPTKLEVCPNCIEIHDKSLMAYDKEIIRNKYDIPLDKRVFVYGGNLGRPQGVPFIIDCLSICNNLEKVFFLIVGDGTEYYLLEEYVTRNKPTNVKLMKRVPKEDYDKIVAACDVGMIFLDHRFTIPNFPSRLLSYMQAKLPVLAITDPHTDIGEVITQGNFGWWCESDNSIEAKKIIERISQMSSVADLGVNSWEYLKNHYDVEDAYKVIIESSRL